MVRSLNICTKCMKFGESVFNITVSYYEKINEIMEKVIYQCSERNFSDEAREPTIENWEIVSWQNGEPFFRKRIFARRSIDLADSAQIKELLKKQEYEPILEALNRYDNVEKKLQYLSLI